MNPSQSKQAPWTLDDEMRASATCVLSVLIINWKSAAFVRECLHTVIGQLPGSELEVVVVDGGSFDGCEEMIRREFPDVRFAQLATNIGFGQANNHGARLCRGEYLLLLNPDTEVDVGALGTLLATVRDIPGAGLAGAKLLNSDRSLQTSCVQALPTLVNQFLDSEWLRRVLPNSTIWGTGCFAKGVDEPVEVEAISGACMLLRRNLFAEVGGFSSEFFMYAEDMDLCHKVRLAGWRVMWVPRAVVVHHGGGSSSGACRSGFSVVMMVESLQRYFRRNCGNRRAVAYRVLMGVKAAVRVSLSLAALSVCWGAQHRCVAKRVLRKWWTVGRWAAGLERWVAKY